MMVCLHCRRPAAFGRIREGQPPVWHHVGGGVVMQQCICCGTKFTLPTPARECPKCGSGHLKDDHVCHPSSQDPVTANPEAVTAFLAACADLVKALAAAGVEWLPEAAIEPLSRVIADLPYLADVADHDPSALVKAVREIRAQIEARWREEVREWQR